MFAFIMDFFKNKDKNNENFGERAELPKPVDLPGNRRRTILYDETLIDTLKADHSELVMIYGRMWREGFEARNFPKLSSFLAEFKRKFQSHLLRENVKFYVYLEQALLDDPHTLQVVKDFRADMNDIANVVIRFCKAYQRDTFTYDLERSFEKDYVKVGEVLTKRVQVEEKDLYTLYQQDL